MEKSLLAIVTIGFGLSIAGEMAAADEIYMLNKCRKYAAGHLHVSSNLIDVKYEGQRTDKTYAVNGGVGPSQAITFQCSFKADGKSIKHFTVNTPEGCPADVSQADRYKYPDCD